MKKNKLKILLLASFFISDKGCKYGGAEKVLTNLSNFLAENTEMKLFYFL